MAGGKLSKREAAYREKQAERQKKPKLVGTRVGPTFTEMLKKAYSHAGIYEYTYGYAGSDEASAFWLPSAPKTPEELDAFYEGQEELQALDEED